MKNNIIYPLKITMLFLFIFSEGYAQMPADEKMIEKRDVFSARTEGYYTYRVPGILTTPQGTILAYCEARQDGRGDWDNIDFVMTRSTDGGEIWQPRQVIANEGENTVNNIAGFADHVTGQVHFLYCVNYGNVYYIRSDDDGQSFSEPVGITKAFDAIKNEYEWNVVATGPGHGIQLESGRLVVPVWLSPGELRDSGTRKHRPSAVTTVYSDDHGETWKSGEIITQHGDRVQDYEVVNPSETVIVELADGRVMVNMRNESEPHRRLVAYSDDGATGWSTPVFHEQLLEPVCMASIVRLSKQPESDQNRLLFVNPNNLFTSEETGSKPNAERRNVTVKLSYDEGENWPVSKVLESGISGYPDIAVGNDGVIYCIYENGGLGSHYSPKSLTIAKFNLPWLTEGSDQMQEIYK